MKYVCTVCGYVYEGESLPADFVCPEGLLMHLTSLTV